MAKIVDDHATRNLSSYLCKRSTLKPVTYLEKKLGVCHATALKYIRDPLQMRLRDIKTLKLTEEEIRGLL
jgi:hypothetical protein